MGLIHGLWKRWNWGDRFVPNSPIFEAAPNWESKRRVGFDLCKQCCMQPWRKAEIGHHLKYTRSRFRVLCGYLFLGHDFGKSVAGYEIPGIDFVPVSKHCHDNYYGSSKSKDSVHYTGDEFTPPYWIKMPRSIDNHQEQAIAFRLRFTFFMLCGGWILLFLPAIVFGSYLLVLAAKP